MSIKLMSQLPLDKISTFFKYLFVYFTLKNKRQTQTIYLETLEMQYNLTHCIHNYIQ